MITPIYLNNFQSRADVEGEFECSIPSNCHILLAWYGNGDYVGSAYVLYEKRAHTGNKLYQVFGSHCSCDGLEGQWEPEETSLEHLRTIKLNDGYYEGTDAAQIGLENIIKQLEI